MKYVIKLLFLYSFVLLSLFACTAIQPENSIADKINASSKFTLNQFEQSKFKQIEATFSTHQSKSIVFRVLSDIKKTPKWLARLDSLEVLSVYNNHQYLLRTIINSPWPFKDRELITCVDTFFEETETKINIYSCSDRVPLDSLYVRISEVESSWVISKKSKSEVEVSYKTWIDPGGNVPAFIFNYELIASTKADFKKLQLIIDKAVLSDYAY